MEHTSRITVVNRHDFSERDLRGNYLVHYIGRGTAFGNPFIICQPYTRSEAIAAYAVECRKAWKGQEHALHPDWKAGILRLVAQVRAGSHLYLVCSCKPRACHGDTIATIVEALANKHTT